MTPEQALIHAIRCFNLKVDPLSQDSWFNRDTWETNLTAAGQRTHARNCGINVGPPQFERVTRPWPAPKPMIVGYKEDVGYICKKQVADRGVVSYTAWLSEWYRPTGPWQSNTEHMLQVRADDKASEFATGVGISNTIEDEPPQLEAGIERLQLVAAPPQVVTSPVEFVPMEKANEK